MTDDETIELLRPYTQQLLKEVYAMTKRKQLDKGALPLSDPEISGSGQSSGEMGDEIIEEKS